MNSKIIFFGTQNFGAGILRCLIESEKYDLVAVITQPDRKIGRDQATQKSPVKILAEQHHLRVLQPETLKNWTLDIGVWNLAIVCQYGLIIPKSILELPKHGFINVHTSLLPEYRGASPIQTAIVNGEAVTGVTIMLMDEKMDRGPILSQTKIQIAPDDTYPDLSEKMEPLAQNLLLKTLIEYLEGGIKPQTQDENGATFCKMFSRDDGRIDWQKSSAEIYNQYRGLTPWPGVWTSLNKKRLKLLKIRPAETQISPGSVKVAKRRIFVGTPHGSIEILSLQLEGKKEQSGASFIDGYPEFDGASLI
ncbi:MAG: methionyl-tRNA formyltransferase [Patescibacteria group bacterium]